MKTLLMPMEDGQDLEPNTIIIIIMMMMIIIMSCVKESETIQHITSAVIN